MTSLSRSVLKPLLALALFLFLMGCNPNPSLPHDKLGRLDFNRLAVQANLPLFWVADANANGAVDPDEVVSLRFYPEEGHWTEGAEFSADFEGAYAQLVALAASPDPAGLSPEEAERRRLVRADLDHGIPTLVASDLGTLDPGSRAFAAHILTAADMIDTIFEQMTGAEALLTKLPDDSASRSLFRRNWGPACLAPRTQDNPACSAIPGSPQPVFDIYPASLQAQDDFCAKLEALPNAEELLNPFVVVRGNADSYHAVPYTDEYADLSGVIASELRAAADALDDPGEDALRAYLRAAAQAFNDNNWEPADEAWSKMTARNSKWYLRIAPDEVYWEPCAQKAGFHVTFARINSDSLKWEDMILPVRQEMENSLAALIGAPYQAREVSFHLPDFIDIVINAGDDREAFGATIGQSLPNWGPVANEGRGRTVAMSNLYTDPDSLRIQHEQVLSLFTSDALAFYADHPEPGLLATILHEATHNFGPAHEYRYQGKTDTEAFGGALSSTMEELKAQTGGLWFTGWLAAREIISQELARQTYLDSMRWAMDHCSRGMYSGSGRPKPYSQLAAIQIGFLMDEGALEFGAETLAANGKDVGAFTLHFDRFPAAIEKLMAQVGQIKATGDRTGAEALIARYVDSDAVPQKLIAERILRQPKANFVYAVTE